MSAVLYATSGPWADAEKAKRTAKAAHEKGNVWLDMAAATTMKAAAFQKKAMTYDEQVHMHEGDADKAWAGLREGQTWSEAAAWEEKKAAVYKENAAECEVTAAAWEEKKAAVYKENAAECEVTAASEIDKAKSFMRMLDES